MAKSKPETTYPIKTIVVLVQENRSFDHVLGWMKTLNPAINGVTGSESNPKSPTNPSSDRVFFQNQASYIVPDPPHSFQAIYEQVFGVPFSESASSSDTYPIPNMEGFVKQAQDQKTDGMTEIVMNGFEPDRVPVYKELVSEFGVCDRWFASLPSSTQPNRLYVHSATSHGTMSNDTNALIRGFPQRTIFESLEESGFSFGIYYQDPPTTLFYG